MTRSRTFRVVRLAGEPSAVEDPIAVEEPLEIRVSGDTLAVTMRTPGHDRELALGFLFAEGLIASAADVSAVAHCGRPGDEGWQNTIEVTPAPGMVIDPEAKGLTRRGTLTSSACGVCGRRSIDDLLARCVTPVAPCAVSAKVITGAVAALRERQPLFRETGGSHGAALFTLVGEHVATYEDVGRHNAVDKLVGARLLAGSVSLREHLLVVSGRASFEIVQKARAAGVAAVASVSAPSTLAIELARRAGLVLAGFVRGESLTVYAGEERVR